MDRAFAFRFGSRPFAGRGIEEAVVVRVEPVKRWKQPVPLARIKSDPDMKDWELVRLPRLSVMPVSEEQWRRVEKLSRELE